MNRATTRAKVIEEMEFGAR
ncbi:hypothetical protein Tco_0381411, partial [Tanacetum coccineum]